MIELSVCTRCQLQLRRAGPTCPSCGGPWTLSDRSGAARVLAATELHAPAEGWPSPHRLALVELEGGGRLLVLTEAPLPVPGTGGAVSEDAEGRLHFRAGPPP